MATAAPHSAIVAGMPTDLTPDLISDFSVEHQDWVKTGESISRTYLFDDF